MVPPSSTYERNTTSARWLAELVAALRFNGAEDYLTDDEVRRALTYRREGVHPSAALTYLLSERGATRDPDDLPNPGKFRTMTVPSRTNLTSYVGRLLRHSAKAVRHGCPADRIFAVTAVSAACPLPYGDGVERLVAWKCTLLEDDRLRHPAYQELLTSDDPRLFAAGQQPNGSEPTAVFAPDSFYIIYR